MEENKKLLIAALVIILGGNTGSILNAVNPSVRADAFTLTDWYKGKADILSVITTCKETNEEKMDDLRQRITTLERNVFYLEQRLP